MIRFLFKSNYKSLFLFQRTYSDNPKKIKPIPYYGFDYFPRSENFEDPPYNPSKLFLVIRVKPTKHLNPVERRSLEVLNIDGERKYNGHINIVKNIPEINKTLWQVKHLVEIKPIIYKGELPTNGDFSGTFLRKTGELIISPKLKVSSEVLNKSENYLNDENRITKKYIKQYLLAKWARHSDVV